MTKKCAAVTAGSERADCGSPIFVGIQETDQQECLSISNKSGGIKMEYVLISSWSHGEEKGGISQYAFDSETGEMRFIKSMNEEKSCNVSYLDKKRGILYVLNECADLDTMRVGGGGEVLAYRLNPESKELELMDSKATCCTNPAHLSLDGTGKYMVIAHHGTRSYVTKAERDESGKFHPVVLFDDSAVELLEIREDGSFGEILDVVKHTGEGPEKRQANAHPHSASVSPSGNLFAVCDKGCDIVVLYRIDRERKELIPCDRAEVPPGSMPRYCVFHPTLPLLYHNSENSMDIHVYRYDESGKMEWNGVYHGLEDDSLAKSAREPVEQQGLCMDKEGRFLYSILRGPNQIGVFEINQEDGSLTLIQNMPIDYGWPRGIALSTDGKFMLLTCFKGEKLVVMRIGEDGKLSHSGLEYDQHNAAYATFWES